MPAPREVPIPAAVQDEFNEYLKLGLKRLRLVESDAPRRIVAAVDTYVVKRQREEPGFFQRLLNRSNDNTELALSLGVVWGTQLIRSFGWQWVKVLDEDAEHYAAASADRSLVIYSTYFVKECLDIPDTDCTVMLSYNMIKAKQIGPVPPNSFCSVMRGIHRIVPRE
jgi:hypothetical protein